MSRFRKSRKNLPQRWNHDCITEIDRAGLFEVSIVPTPANPDARIVSMKAAGGEYARVRNETAAFMRHLMSVDTGTDRLHHRAERIVREPAPTQIATFDC